MSPCLPLRWLPGALPGQVEAALRDTLERWAREWGAPPPAAVTARLLVAGASPEGAAATLSNELPKAWPAALARALLGPAAPASPIAQGAVQQATVALQEALRPRFQGQLAPFVPARVGHGGVDVRFELVGVPFGFVLDVAALQAGGWLPAAPARRLSAVAFEQALHDVPVPLTAQLGHASVSVTDVLKLQPGDVLLLAQTLDAPLQVISPGSSLQLRAHLGAHPGVHPGTDATPSTPARRAMRWLAS